VTVITPNRGRRTFSSLTVWDPTARQEWEEDTIYLLDPAAEALKVSGEDGLIGGNQQNGTSADAPSWEGGTVTAVVPGKYRDGIKSLTTGGYLFLPLDGMIPTREFTAEYFLKGESAWASAGGTPWQAAMSAGAAGNQLISTRISGANIELRYAHLHGAVALDRQLAVAHGGVAAGTWKSVAFTLLAETLRLYLDGVLAGTLTGCPPPASWGSQEPGGMGFPNTPGNAPTFTISDLRLSERARIPFVGV
jgi:hypothetical protein